MILTVAANLKVRDLRSGDVLALDIDNPVYSLVAALATGGLGAAWVHATREALDSTTLNVRFLLTDRLDRHSGDPRLYYLDTSWLSLPVGMKGIPSLQLDGFTNGMQAFAIAQSSGTTGSAKLMVISATNAYSRSDPIHLLDKRDLPVVASFFHPLHQGNMWNILRVLRVGGTFLFGGGIENWLGWGASYVIGSPAHYLRERALILEQKKQRIASAWIGGGPIYAQQLKDLLKMFQTVYVTFGASEAGIICSKAIVRESLQDGQMRLGQVDKRCELEVVDESGQPLCRGSEGFLRMKTPWLVNGYLGDSEATGRFFVDGWFYTGDTGLLDESGELVITGRHSEALNVSGTKINPSLVDEVIISHPLVEDAMCFIEKTSDGNDILAAVLVPYQEAQPELFIDEIYTEIESKYGRSRVPVNFYISSAIPRNTNGKAMRLMVSEQISAFTKIRQTTR